MTTTYIARVFASPCSDVSGLDDAVREAAHTSIFRGQSWLYPYDPPAVGGLYIFDLSLASPYDGASKVARLIHWTLRRFVAKGATVDVHVLDSDRAEWRDGHLIAKRGT